MDLSYPLCHLFYAFHYKRPSESLSDGLSLLQNQISVAPAQAGAQCKAALCLFCAFLKTINFLTNRQLVEVLNHAGECILPAFLCRARRFVEAEWPDIERQEKVMRRQPNCKLCRPLPRGRLKPFRRPLDLCQAEYLSHPRRRVPSAKQRFACFAHF